LARQRFIDRVQPAEILPCLGDHAGRCIRLPSLAPVWGDCFHD
jgi:hypothetical protein